MKKDKKVGRPPKSSEMKKSAKIFINMTEKQKEQLVKKANELDVSLSHICLQALKDKGII